MRKAITLDPVILVIGFFVFVWALIGLMGCASPPVLGSCEVPAHYDQTKTLPPDLPPGTHVKEALEAATAERGAHKIDVDDYNGFLGYVKLNCNGATK